MEMKLITVILKPSSQRCMLKTVSQVQPECESTEAKKLTHLPPPPSPQYFDCYLAYVGSDHGQRTYPPCSVIVTTIICIALFLDHLGVLTRTSDICSTQQFSFEAVLEKTSVTNLMKVAWKTVPCSESSMTEATLS